ncbi:MAG: response regulator transcription factor [Balneola sp.]|nr:response regulator transcription factor [Balneola sp.]MBO6649665.1 response regulator transcription factor [Balneola sp.]MBO6712227.1 response regulator transcription factor [Balneola sp.]MBO6800421.1 response regulator transcription factor [Balneola sp.]MBO6871787.1 response regulator transcription factor [Balneola sp.]
MNLSCFIIDDEPLAIEVIESHVSKIDGLEVKATFQNAVKAFQALRESQVDILFLDIQMPRLTGIEFLRMMKNPPKVIFTTAYREYALEGFELDVVDYLLKPISFNRFLKAVDKVFDLESDAEHRTSSSDESNSKQFVFVPVDKKNVKICLNEIVFIESKRDYVHIKTLNKEVVTHQTLTYMEERLPNPSFLRVHRSFIINTKMIESWSNNEIELPGIQIPIGRTYKREALKVLNNNSEVL